MMNFQKELCQENQPTKQEDTKGSCTGKEKKLKEDKRKEAFTKTGEDEVSNKGGKLFFALAVIDPSVSNGEKFAAVPEPKSCNEAHQGKHSQKWIAVEEAELKSLEGLGTWTHVCTTSDLSVLFAVIYHTGSVASSCSHGGRVVIPVNRATVIEISHGAYNPLSFGSFATTQGKQANTVFKAEKHKSYILVIYLTKKKSRNFCSTQTNIICGSFREVESSAILSWLTILDRTSETATEFYREKSGREIVKLLDSNFLLPCSFATQSISITYQHCLVMIVCKGCQSCKFEWDKAL
nr:AlNc14C123G6750 [Albugo laibachii Nc14]|eukprot:CCA21474.1 AlNc14C123G6750 [Albugo laibachii Nc14]